MKQQIIDLWKISFGDPDEFIQLYFDRVYQDENTFVINQNGRIVSALQILPFEMTYCGTTIPVGYICGVCTLPSEQGKGFMKQLMFMALEEMHKRDYALAILIPASSWLFDYYRRFDFANAFDYSIEEISRNNPPANQPNNQLNNPTKRLSMNPVSGLRILSLENLSPDTVYAYFRKKQCERSMSVLHSACQFETICLDWTLGKGEIWMAFTNERPVGLAFTMFSTNESLTIREIMVENEATKNALVQAILDHYQLPTAKLRLPPTLPNSIPYGMARVINKEKMIELYRSSLGGGEGSRFKVVQGSRFKVQGSNLPDFADTNISSLTQILLKYEQRQAFMNLMMD